jgi:phosphate transport system substrate-binding protein
MSRIVGTARLLTTLLAVIAAPLVPNLRADSLPQYVKKASARGTIRICGDMQGGLLELLEDAFVKIHPNLRFSNIPAASQVGVAGMILGIADLAIAGAPMEPAQVHLLDKVGGARPVEISIAGGSFDVRGRSAVLAVYVHRTNPLEKLTMKQLDGIFAEERNAGWKDQLWDDAQARGAERNLRTWGQLGLTGEWAGRQIHTYGLSWGGPSIFMTRVLTGDSGKWNPTYRTYNIEGFARGKALTSQMMADMSADPSCIGWTQMIFAANAPELKPVALAWNEQGPYVLPSRETLANRTYPLNRDIFIYARVPLDRAQSEFLRFILSAEGQRIVAEHGIFNPLTPGAIQEQIKKIE